MNKLLIFLEIPGWFHTSLFLLPMPGILSLPGLIPPPFHLPSDEPSIENACLPLSSGLHINPAYSYTSFCFCFIFNTVIVLSIAIFQSAQRQLGMFSVPFFRENVACSKAAIMQFTHLKAHIKRHHLSFLLLYFFPYSFNLHLYIEVFVHKVLCHLLWFHQYKSIFLRYTWAVTMHKYLGCILL